MIQNDNMRLWGQTFFKYRDYTPIPLILLLMLIHQPTVASATAGTLVVVLGELIRIYSVAFIGSISRTRKGTLGDHLVTEGPFGIVRNPLYVGNFLIVLGFLIHAKTFWFGIFTVVLFFVQYLNVVVYEEGLLREKFGQTFETYCETVPAWFPRRIPLLRDLAWPDTFSPALWSERRTLTSIVVVFILLSL